MAILLLLLLLAAFLQYGTPFRWMPEPDAPTATSGCVTDPPPPITPANHTTAPAPAPLGAGLVLGEPVAANLSQWPGLIDVTPTVADLDADGHDEIIAQSTDAHVYVFDGQDGRARAVLETVCPAGWHIDHVLNSVAVASMRPGEAPSLVVTSHAAYITRWQVGADRALHKVWEVRATGCTADASMDASPAVGDLDGDGVKEVLVQVEEVGLFALNADGSTKWKHCWSGGNSEPSIVDLEDDGKMEALFASDSGRVAVFDGSSGRPRWTFNAADPQWGITPASISVRPTVAELDGAAPKEVIFTARHAPSGDATQFPTFHMAIFAIHHDTMTGKVSVLWMRQPEWAHPLSYTHIVAADVDGDGSMDLFGMDWNTVGHLPGNWEPLGPGHAFRLNARGEDVWVRSVDSWWSNKDVALTNRGGEMELVVNGAREGVDGFYRLSASTGTPVGFVSAGPWKVNRGPVLADLRHDGTLWLVASVGPADPRDIRGGILVVDFEAATKVVSGSA